MPQFFKNIGRVSYLPTFKGIDVRRMPFVIGDISSLPHVREIGEIVQDVCEMRGLNKLHGSIGYLTLTQKLTPVRSTHNLHKKEGIITVPTVVVTSHKLLKSYRLCFAANDWVQHVFPPNEVYELRSSARIKSIVMNQDVWSTLLAIEYPHDNPWEMCNTPNPKGILPEGEIVIPKRYTVETLTFNPVM